jgi:uncharacterized membrane-anchored protein
MRRVPPSAPVFASVPSVWVWSAVLSSAGVLLPPQAVRLPAIIAAAIIAVMDFAIVFFIIVFLL